MPKKMNTCVREKVLVAVYVERPTRRRRVLPAANYHHHLHLHQANNNYGGASGGNRRAELLNYSRRLRESATPSPHHHNNKPLHSYIQQPINQIMAVQGRPKKARHPTCMGNWKVVIPRFLRSLTMLQGKKGGRRKKRSSSKSASMKAKTIMQSFQVQKRKGFLKKFLAAIQKYR